MHVDAVAFLLVLHPLAIIIAAVMAFPGALTMLHAFLPLSDIHLLIEPAELTVAFAIAVHVATLVDPFAG